jgi:hypothetical protein
MNWKLSGSELKLNWKLIESELKLNQELSTSSLQVINEHSNEMNSIAFAFVTISMLMHSQVPGWTHSRVHQSVVAESWDLEGAPGFQL